MNGWMWNYKPSASYPLLLQVTSYEVVSEHCSVSTVDVIDTGCLTQVIESIEFIHLQTSRPKHSYYRTQPNVCVNVNRLNWCDHCKKSMTVRYDVIQNRVLSVEMQCSPLSYSRVSGLTGSVNDLYRLQFQSLCFMKIINSMFTDKIFNTFNTY